MIDKLFFVISLLVIFLLALLSYMYELSGTAQVDVILESERSTLEADFGEMRKQYAEMKHHMIELEGRLESAEEKQQKQVEPNVYTNNRGIITVVDDEPLKPSPKPPILNILVPKKMNDKPVVPIPVGGTKLSSEHVGAGQYTTCQMPQDGVDIVYTWVNGSDPSFKKSFSETDLGMETNKEDIKPQRFQDFNQLKYSIRSVQMYAPWIRTIFIVTNGQHPLWLNTTTDRIRIISHEQIFTDKSDLPTFNSRAIESHLHQIPGLADDFLYLNDDFTFTRKVCIDDWWSTKTGYKIYAKGAVKHKDVTKLCSTECLNELFGNNQCEQQCNKVGCAWDGDDCDGVVPPGGITDHRAGFYQSLDFVNILYEIKLVQDEPRYLQPHFPAMMNKRIMGDLHDYFERFYTVTSSHRKRQKNDMQTQFSYYNWLIEAPKSQAFLTPGIYKSTRVSTAGIYYIPWWTDMRKNQPAIDKFFRMKAGIKFLCINDLMEHDQPSAEIARSALEAIYNKLYPNKSTFEL